MTRPKSETHLPDLEPPMADKPKGQPMTLPRFIIFVSVLAGGFIAGATLAMAGNVAEPRLDPEVTKPARTCFLCGHQGFDYKEPGGGDRRISIPAPQPEPQPEEQVCE